MLKAERRTYVYASIFAFPVAKLFQPKTGPDISGYFNSFQLISGYFK
jgi:hypothetical protein